MINLKNLLIKIIERLDFKVVEVITSNVTVAANAAYWFTVTCPQNTICLCGYYIEGNGQRFRTYATYVVKSNNAAYLAAQNATSTATSTKVHFYFLTWAGGGTS